MRAFGTVGTILAGLAGLISTSVLAASPIFHMKAYWPHPAAGKEIIIRFDVGRLDFYRKGQDGYLLEDGWHLPNTADRRDTVKWSSTWHYRADSKNGVVEFGDDVPDGKGGSVSARFSPGFEIWWGDVMRVGETIDHKVGYANHPDRRAFGRQRVTLAAFYPQYALAGRTYQNVIRLDDQQDVCKASEGSPGSLDRPGQIDCKESDVTTSKYYLARGIGIIRIEDPVTNGKRGFARTQNAVNVCIVDRAPDAYCPIK